MEHEVRIAFVGKPNAGQTSAAVYLKRAYGFKRVRFIGGVNRICKFLYNYKTYERPPWELRRAMYDALYKIDPNIWVSYIQNRMKRTTEPIVVDDAKYINEVQALKDLGFIIIRINTADRNRAKSIGRYLGTNIQAGTVVLTEYFNKDASDVLKVDYSIYHDGSLQNLRKTLDEIMKKFDREIKNPL